MFKATDKMNSKPSLVIEGKVATITLKKAEFANRLSVEDLKEIRQHIERVNQLDSVLVLRILAEGKYFCSGFDLKAFGADTSLSTLQFGETVDAIESARPITIAAIQGGVYGGGTDLCIACDFRVGTNETNMFIPAAKLGLHFYPGGLRRYVNRVGLDKSKEIFLLAKHYAAEELKSMGFLTHLVKKDDLSKTIQEITNKLSQMAPLALLPVKKHLNLIANNEFQIEEITQLVKASEASNDIKEGVSAWAEKREPIFKGS
ncbi:enoyl-CoA hydratase/isomerase family protein [Oligella urethralis]|uniref:enoyl-CoA hydratase/isomerase family protein n=1 Tax=Oligella urethralis TaxID=90245 RepID=UPI0021556BBF|nr:enoyl-CoA hydratase/isomerase family protein [Oligella urethralis]